MRRATAVQPSDRAVLGLWDGHDAGAALVRAGRVVAAVSEERLTRVKGQGGFPYQAIARVLALAGAAPAEVDAVAVAGRHGRLPARLLDRTYAGIAPQSVDPLSLPSRLHAEYQDRLARTPVLGAAERWGSELVLRRRLDELGLRHAALSLVDHHEAHARAAAAVLAAIPALVVTMDGYGDGHSMAIWSAGSNGLERLAAAGTESSAALVYGALTRLLGFAEGEEGKVTGLAGSFRPSLQAAAPPELSPFFVSDSGRLRVDRRGALQALRSARRAGAAPEALAHALQRPMEEAVLAVVGHYLRATGLRRLAVAGGLFANVALNGRLAALELDEFVVCPAMTDQGLCVGAALAAAGELRAGAMPTVLLGPDLPGIGPDPARVARALAEGAVIGVARRRLEFGPRALGNRSILFDPRDPARAAGLNARLERDPCMPFAPVLASSSWDDAFATRLSRVERASREMTLALPARPAFAALAPVTVHDDGSARPQRVEETDDPWLHAVLAQFRALTGCPALVNTSFNRHREPIVCTAAEALESGRAAGLDALVIGGDWIEPAVR